MPTGRWCNDVPLGRCYDAKDREKDWSSLDYLTAFPCRTFLSDFECKGNENLELPDR